MGDVQDNLAGSTLLLCALQTEVAYRVQCCLRRDELFSIFFFNLIEIFPLLQI